MCRLIFRDVATSDGEMVEEPARPASCAAGTDGGRPSNAGSTRSGSSAVALGAEEEASGGALGRAGSWTAVGAAIGAGRAPAGLSSLLEGGAAVSAPRSGTERAGGAASTGSGRAAGAAAGSGCFRGATGWTSTTAGSTGWTTARPSAESFRFSPASGRVASTGFGSGATGGRPSSTGSTRSGAGACADASPGYPPASTPARPQQRKSASCWRRSVRFIRTFQRYPGAPASSATRRAIRRMVKSQHSSI